MKTRRNSEKGVIKGSIVAIVVLVILVIGFGAFSVWAYLQYMDQKKDVDGKIDVATAEAVKKNSEEMQAKFEAAEKEPKRQFAGPSDYGSLTFDYPKTWSAYQATDISKGGGVTYEAYLNPVLVPPITQTSKFALRITIEQKTYDQSVAQYDPYVKRGDLKSSAYSDGKRTGVKLVGNFTKDIYGTAILLKMRDRTLTIRTDGDVFTEDYEALLKTVKFNE